MRRLEMPGDEARELFWGNVLFGIFIVTDLVAAIVIVVSLVWPFLQ